jgi:hypothetical protein
METKKSENIQIPIYNYVYLINNWVLFITRFLIIILDYVLEYSFEKYVLFLFLFQNKIVRSENLYENIRFESIVYIEQKNF